MPTPLCSWTALYGIAPTANAPELIPVEAADGLRHVLGFDYITDESIMFLDLMPGTYNGTSDLSVDISFLMESGNPGTKVVRWDVSFERIQSGDILGSTGISFYNIQSGESTVYNTATKNNIGTVTFTNAEADGIQPNEWFRTKITRNNTTLGTNASGDAQLMGTSIRLA